MVAIGVKSLLFLMKDNRTQINCYYLQLKKYICINLCSIFPQNIINSHLANVTALHLLLTCLSLTTLKILDNFPLD